MAFGNHPEKEKKGNQNKSQVPLIPVFHIKNTATFHLSTVTTLFEAFLSGSVRAGKRLGFTMKSPLLNTKLQNMCKETSLGKFHGPITFRQVVVVTIVDQKRPDLGV